MASRTTSKRKWRDFEANKGNLQVHRCLIGCCARLEWSLLTSSPDFHWQQLQEAEKLLKLAETIQRKVGKGDLAAGMNEDEIKGFVQTLHNCSPRKLDERKLQQAFGEEMAHYFDESSEYESFNFPTKASSRKNVTGDIALKMSLNRAIL